jgi:hypothetical protein
MTPYPLYRRPGGNPESVWTDAEILAPTGIRSPNQPVVSRYTEYAIPAHIKYFTEDKIYKYIMGGGVSDEYVQRIFDGNLKGRDDVQNKKSK